MAESGKTLQRTEVSSHFLLAQWLYLFSLSNLLFTKVPPIRRRRRRDFFFGQAKTYFFWLNLIELNWIELPQIELNLFSFELNFCPPCHPCCLFSAHASVHGALSRVKIHNPCRRCVIHKLSGLWAYCSERCTHRDKVQLFLPYHVSISGNFLPLFACRRSFGLAHSEPQAWRQAEKNVFCFVLFVFFPH